MMLFPCALFAAATAAQLMRPSAAAMPSEHSFNVSDVFMGAFHSSTSAVAEIYPRSLVKGKSHSFPCIGTMYCPLSWSPITLSPADSGGRGEGQILGAPRPPKIGRASGHEAARPRARPPVPRCQRG